MYLKCTCYVLFMRVVARAAPNFLREQVQSAFDGVHRRHVPVERQEAPQRVALRASARQPTILHAMAARQCHSHVSESQLGHGPASQFQHAPPSHCGGLAHRLGIGIFYHHSRSGRDCTRDDGLPRW